MVAFPISLYPSINTLRSFEWSLLFNLTVDDTRNVNRHRVTVMKALFQQLQSLDDDGKEEFLTMVRRVQNQALNYIDLVWRETKDLQLEHEMNEAYEGNAVANTSTFAKKLWFVLAELGRRSFRLQLSLRDEVDHPAQHCESLLQDFSDWFDMAAMTCELRTGKFGWEDWANLDLDPDYTEEELLVLPERVLTGPLGNGLMNALSSNSPTHVLYPVANFHDWADYMIAKDDFWVTEKFVAIIPYQHFQW